MKKWIETRKGADFSAVASKFNISPMLARIIRNRDVVGEDAIGRFLEGLPEDMYDPALLKDIDKAAECILDSIACGDKIRVIGDYDIDGICASYILEKAFALMGADVDAKLPDRIADGYGLNKSLIDRAYADGINLIVTCDNGIAAIDEIAYAKSLGVKVVVTDHHEVPYEENNGVRTCILPKADAVVDPKREDCAYPYKGICGAMVAYKLVVYITNQAGVVNVTEDATLASKNAVPAVRKSVNIKLEQSTMNELLLFAAFATVGDVMELLDENRIAVKYGLKLMAESPNVGLRALIEVTGLDKDNISAYHIGFVLGPCINATGRLDTAERALRLLECEDYEEAILLAQELKDINESRKNMTLMQTEEAIKVAENDDDKVLVVFLKECHESLAGIVAGRLREKFWKPSIVITESADGLKGSGRSIEEYNMYEELNKVSQLFSKFGGHKMAAGLSMSEDRVDELRQLLNRNTTLKDDDIVEKCKIDMRLPISYATLELANELKKLEPYGVGNPKPLFAMKDVPVKGCRLVGRNQNVLKLTVADENMMIHEAVIFDNAQEAFEIIKERATISILYQIDINSYMGREGAQLIVKDFF